jgi:hypothetical protein
VDPGGSVTAFVATCAVEDRSGTCGFPTQGFLCSKHRDELVLWLWDIGGVQLGDSGEYQASLLDELDTTICGDDKVGGTSIGIVSRSDEHSVRFNERASDVKRTLVNALVGWARVFAEENAHLVFAPATVEDAARWMASFPGLLESHPAAVEMHRDIREVVFTARHAVDRRAQRVFLGECGGEFEGVRCTAPLFALEGRHEARCHVCTSEWSMESRREMLLDRLEDTLAHSGRLAALVRANGRQIASSTIRSYATRGKIVARGKDDRGRPVYRVGDVLDVLLKRSREAAA